MRGSIVGWSSLVVAVLGAAPALATHHEKAHHSKTPAHHAVATRHVSPAKHGGSSKHASHHRDTARTPSRTSNAPSGATSVPGGGIKLYCGPGKNPLMIRKMTQGSGTTVTVICR